MKKIKVYNPLKVITRDEVFTSRATEPKIKEVESEGRDIIKYPIEEAKLDQEGNLIPIVKPPFYEPTGRSLEWTIMKGETLVFPEYVANLLKKRYDFLQLEEEIAEAVKPEPSSEEDTYSEAKPKDGVVVCKFCGQNFRNNRAYGLHIAAKHAEKLSEL